MAVILLLFLFLRLVLALDNPPRHTYVTQSLNLENTLTFHHPYNNPAPPWNFFFIYVFTLVNVLLPHFIHPIAVNCV